jgi:hypothetical protein
MPDPISASTDLPLCSLTEGVTADENDAQMSLSSAHPSAGAAPSAPSTAPAPPAVSALVARFTPPAGTHPPVEPSLGTALLNCKVATAAYVANTVGVVALAPETLGWSFVVGALRIGATGAALVSCIDKSEAEQVRAGTLANQAEDCRSAGATPLTGSDGNVVCVK